MKTTFTTHNNIGFSLIELLISVGIGSIIALGIATVMLQLAREQTQSVSSFHFGQFQRSIIRNLSHDQAWSYTIEAGSTSGPHPQSKMNCLVAGTPCTVDGTVDGDPIQNQAFALYDESNGLFFDSTRETSGLNSRGDLCDTFLTSESNNCPFRYDLQWSAVCLPGDCVNPLVKITAKFSTMEDDPHKIFSPSIYTIASIYRLRSDPGDNPSCLDLPGATPLATVDDLSNIASGTIDTPNVYCLTNDIVMTSQPRLGVLDYIELDGNGYSLIGLQIGGLFSGLRYSKVSDLVLSAPDFSVSGPGGNGGFLANVLSRSEISNIRVVNIPSSSIVSGSTNKNRCGLVAGGFRGGSARQIYLEPNGASILCMNYAGFVFGEVKYADDEDENDEASFKDIVVWGSGTLEGENAGGVFGQVGRKGTYHNIHIRGDYTFRSHGHRGMIFGSLRKIFNPIFKVSVDGVMNLEDLNYNFPSRLDEEIHIGGLIGVHSKGNKKYPFSILNSSVNVAINTQEVLTKEDISIGGLLGKNDKRGMLVDSMDVGASFSIGVSDQHKNKYIGALIGISDDGDEDLEGTVVNNIKVRSSITVNGDSTIPRPPRGIRIGGTIGYVEDNDEELQITNSSFDMVVNSNLDPNHRQVAGTFIADNAISGFTFLANVFRFTVNLLMPTPDTHLASDYLQGGTPMTLTDIGGGMGTANVGGAPQLTPPAASILGNLASVSMDDSRLLVQGSACEDGNDFPVFVLISVGPSAASREVIGVAESSPATGGVCAGNSTGAYSFLIGSGIIEKYAGQKIFAEAFGRWASLTTLLAGSGTPEIP